MKTKRSLQGKVTVLLQLNLIIFPVFLSPFTGAPKISFVVIVDVCHHYPVTEYGMRAISLILAYYNNKYLEI
jgi:hypothetical protein